MSLLTLRDATNRCGARLQQRMEKTADFSTDFDVDLQRVRPSFARETDPHKLHQRQKQIDFGKNTLGYAAYVKEVPRHRREEGHPVTPDKTKACSKRTFDGMIKKWRRDLHRWDPSAEDGELAQPLGSEMPPPPPPPADAEAPAAPMATPPPQGADCSGAGVGSAAGSPASHRSGKGCSSNKRRLDSTEGGANGREGDASQPKLQRTGAAAAASELAPEAEGIQLLVGCVGAEALDDIFGDWSDDDVQI